MQATKYNKYRSERPQLLDSLKIKWFSEAIRGDIQPLIGNIVQNSPIIQNSDYFPYQPNEIAAVMGDTLIIMDGAGKILVKFPLVTGADMTNDIIGISALLDTNANHEDGEYEYSGRSLILGFESIEAQRSDSLAVTYIGGWVSDANNFSYIRKLALNLQRDSIKFRDYLPNFSASLKPIYARKRYVDEYSSEDGGYTIYATANMSQPKIDPYGYNTERPYFRGLTAFHLHSSNISFPLPAEGDTYEYRIHLGPQVSFAQPSITQIQWDTANRILLPCMPSPVADNLSIVNSTADATVTEPDNSYLFRFTMMKDGVLSDEYNSPFQLFEEIENASRPRIRSYFVDLINPGDEYDNYNPRTYILATTEYAGTISPTSKGKSGLFLFDQDGTQLYDFYDSDSNQAKLPYLNDSNHYWSVAVGNLDGPSWNEWRPYFPNNPGNEIIVSESSRDFAYAGNRIMVFRYNSSELLQPKPSPPQTALRNFDTLCTFPIQGWIAAVNDIDGTDGKDEVLLVSGSTIYLLRMNDYASVKFRNGQYFDTIYKHQYGHQTITSAAIADIDGDGLNDIIVTTNEGIYIMGTPLERTITLTDFKVGTNYQTDWCFGDTVKIKWYNIIQGHSAVNILFQETYSGQPINEPIILESNYSNTTDTTTYNFIVPFALANKAGRFIVQSSTNPIKNADTTGLFYFHRPEITTDLDLLNTLYIGSEFTINGTVTCSDNVKLYYSFDTTNWVYIAEAFIDSLGQFSITANVPCLPIFDCNENKMDTTAYGRITFTNNASMDSSTVFLLTLRPANFPLTISPCENACASRTIEWEIADTTIAGGLFNVLMSTDTGKTFRYLNTVPISLGRYIWDVPTTVTTPIILRFCGEQYCFQSDTMLWNYAPKYLQTVAPNPLKIPEIAEIIYNVPEDCEVTIRIIDQSNRYVKEIIKNQPRTGGFAYCERWDGRLDDLTPCSNGMYYIMLDFSNGVKEVYPIYIRN
jgi:hypothetical protein